jgi:hypothetical protein
MTARAIDSGIRDRTRAEDEFVPWRKGIDARRIFLHQEVSAESLSTKIGFIDRVRDSLFFESLCFEIDSQDFVKKAFHGLKASLHCSESGFN